MSCDKLILSALSGLSEQQTQAVKTYIQEAKRAGQTDIQILNELKNATGILNSNKGGLALSLKYEERYVWSAIVFLSITAVVGGAWSVYYLINSTPVNQPNGVPNQQQRDQEQSDNQNQD